jgi:hypothetical protein
MFVGLNEVKEGQSNLIGAQIEQGIKEKSAVQFVLGFQLAYVFVFGP